MRNPLINPWKTDLIPANKALPGRLQAIPTARSHFLSGQALKGELPKGMEEAIFAMGCFWGVEKLFWGLPGVEVTAVGYAGGITPNPTYEEVCSGKTGHTEAVRVVFNPKKINYEDLLKIFWEGHDPTQGMRQGNDRGTQYRSGIYWTNPAQKQIAEKSAQMFQAELDKAGQDKITTEIREAGPFYFAEADHQQYLARNPNGYCGLDGTGVTCPIGTGITA